MIADLTTHQEHLSLLETGNWKLETGNWKLETEFLPMFIHTVYFWLKPDLSDDDKIRFWEGARSLTTIESVRHGFLGTPAPTDRPIIDRSYSAALTVIFDDQPGHDLYQDHPVHDKFRVECADCWSKVLIYDSITNN